MYLFTIVLRTNEAVPIIIIIIIIIIKTCVVPVVVGSLGMVTKNLAKYLGKIGVPTKIKLPQKAILLGSARILRNVLEA